MICFYVPLNWPITLACSGIVFSVFLCFSLGSFCQPLFKFPYSFLSCVESTDNTLNLFSISDTVFSISISI